MYVYMCTARCSSFICILRSTYGFLYFHAHYKPAIVYRSRDADEREALVSAPRGARPALVAAAGERPALARGAGRARLAPHIRGATIPWNGHYFDIIHVYFICMCTCAHVRMYTYIYIYTYTYIYIYIERYVYLHICVCMYMYVHIYIYTYI